MKRLPYKPCKKP